MKEHTNYVPCIWKGLLKYKNLSVFISPKFPFLLSYLPWSVDLGKMVLINSMVWKFYNLLLGHRYVLRINTIVPVKVFWVLSGLRWIRGVIINQRSHDSPNTATDRAKESPSVDGHLSKPAVHFPINKLNGYCLSRRQGACRHRDIFVSGWYTVWYKKQYRNTSLALKCFLRR